MKKFEYQILSIDAGYWDNDINNQQLAIRLNELGAEGWEIISAFDINSYQGKTASVKVFLKRELSQS